MVTLVTDAGEVEEAVNKLLSLKSNTKRDNRYKTTRTQRFNWTMNLKDMSCCILDISGVSQNVHATFTRYNASISETKKMSNDIKDFLIPTLGVVSTDILAESVKLALIPSTGYVHKILENATKSNDPLENIKNFLEQVV